MDPTNNQTITNHRALIAKSENSFNQLFYVQELFISIISETDPLSEAAFRCVNKFCAKINKEWSKETHKCFDARHWIYLPNRERIIKLQPDLEPYLKENGTNPYDEYFELCEGIYKRCRFNEGDGDSPLMVFPVRKGIQFYQVSLLHKDIHDLNYYLILRSMAWKLKEKKPGLKAAEEISPQLNHWYHMHSDQLQQRLKEFEKTRSSMQVIPSEIGLFTQLKNST